MEKLLNGYTVAAVAEYRSSIVRDAFLRAGQADSDGASQTFIYFLDLAHQYLHETDDRIAALMFSRNIKNS